METQDVIEIFEPPMCCAGGLCGPEVDENLLRFNEALITLKKQLGNGIATYRYLANQQFEKFKANAAVMKLIHGQAMSALPVTVVNGAVLHQGAYPTLEELLGAINGKGENEEV